MTLSNMARLFPLIDSDHEHSIRQPTDLVVTLGIVALVIGLVYLQWFPLPFMVTTLTLLVFAVMATLNHFLIRWVGTDAAVYRIANYLESFVILAGFTIQLGMGTMADPLVWAFYLVMVMLHAQTTGPSISGLITVALAPSVLLILSIFTTIEVDQGFIIGGTLVACALFWFFGTNRQKQMITFQNMLQAEMELAESQAELTRRENLATLHEDWLSTLEHTASALYVLDEKGEIAAQRGSSDFLVEELAVKGWAAWRDFPEKSGGGVNASFNLYGVPIPDSENQYADIRVVAMPQHDATRRYAVLIQDATDRMQLEAYQQEVHDKLAMTDKMASLGTLAAGVAHEINNPLTYILGNLEYIRKDALSPKAERSLDDVEEGFHQIAGIVQDLKVFSHPSREADFEYTDLRHVCQRVERMVKTEIRTLAQLTLDLPEDPVTVACRPDRIHQILLNLLINAKQAFQEEAPSTNRVQLTLSCDADQAYIQVADNGCGIAKENLRQVFDPFFTTKHPGVGTGLGLSVSYRIAVEHGGRLSVQPAQEGGTVFTLALPLTPSSTDTGTKAPVLIIDDEERTLRLLSKVFVEYTVSTASTLDEARVLLQEDFKAVLCDVRLPGGLGFQLYEEAPEALKKRFLFLTALPSHAIEMRGTPENARVLHKPIPLDKLRYHLRCIVTGDELHDKDPV